MSLALRLALLFVFAAAAVLMILLATASSSSSTFDPFYPWLVGANVLVAALMAGLTVWVVFRAWNRYRQGVFGARLMVRLAIAFALIGAVPVALVSMVSAQFLTKTIDSWFSQSVNTALESGLLIGRSSLDGIQADVMSKARRLALQIEEVPAPQIAAQIEQAIDDREGIDVLVISSSGAVLASRSAALGSLVPNLPAAEALNRARAARQFVAVEPAPGTNIDQLQVRAIAMTSRMTALGEDTRFIQWIEQIPLSVSQNLEALNAGIQAYEELTLGKEGLRKLYGISLLLTLLLAFFAALLSAVLLSGWLAGPLRQLERATKAVASGDYRPLRVDPRSTDELNVLVGSFNEMTAQLNEARDIASESRTQLESSNQFLQQVLAHLSAGVLIFDGRWVLVQWNAGAERILGESFSVEEQRQVSSIRTLADCASQLATGLSKDAELQFQHETLREDGSDLTLLVSGSRLPGPDPGAVLIFDDISAVLSAQRSKTFSDMARRLAHEIKNPLTPIQLSAERLQRRLSGKLGAEDAELLGRSIDTIVAQVDALKTMVDEFRNFARLPTANPEPVELEQLLSEMLVLYATDRRISWQPSGVSRWISVDRAQLIQVVHNLVQNAQDAVAEVPNAEIRLEIEDVLDEAGQRFTRLSVLDNGPGLIAEIKSRLFEPYFTSKPKGSGLGLAIVKKIVEENQGRVSLKNRQAPGSDQNLGAVATIEFAKLLNEADNQKVNSRSATA
jgi:nitrogen fixation/metabolism regulation signal transduction histidine kinase